MKNKFIPLPNAYEKEKKRFQNILSIINLNALKSVAILPILYSKSNTPENFLMVIDSQLRL